MRKVWIQDNKIILKRICSRPAETSYNVSDLNGTLILWKRTEKFCGGNCVVINFMEI